MKSGEVWIGQEFPYLETVTVLFVGPTSVRFVPVGTPSYMQNSLVKVMSKEKFGKFFRKESSL